MHLQQGSLLRKIERENACFQQLFCLNNRTEINANIAQNISQGAMSKVNEELNKIRAILTVC